MSVCQAVPTFFTNCSIDKSGYEWEYGTQLARVLSSQHASNLIVSIDPVQVSLDVTPRIVDVYGVGSAISADGH